MRKEPQQTKDGNWYIEGRYGVQWYGKERPPRVTLGKDTSAVSPVIAVILMVAITVVLAATVFVLVSDIGGNVQDATPAMSFQQDIANGNLTVTQATRNHDWSAFTVTGCSTVPTGTVDAGDRLSGCAGDVTIRHNPSNSLVYSGRF